MKYLIYLLPLILLCTSVDAQNKKNKKKKKSKKNKVTNQHLKFNFGALIDYELYGTGFLSREIGMYWKKDDRIVGGDISYGFGYYNANYDKLLEKGAPIYANPRVRSFFQFEYYQTYRLLEGKKTHLYAGPFVGAGLLYKRYSDKEVDGYYNQVYQVLLNVGIGGRLDLLHYFNDNFGLSLSAKYGFADIGIGAEREKLLNPVLSPFQQAPSAQMVLRADLDRGYIPIHVGFFVKF